MIKKYNVQYFMASVDPLEGEQGNKAFAEAHKADFPLLSDPTKKTAEAYGVLNERGMANRWTFYIGKDGKILAIDKAVKPATSAEDMAAKLGELKVEPAHKPVSRIVTAPLGAAGALLRRHYPDLEQLRPQLAGHEQAIAGRVVGDAVQHVDARRVARIEQPRTDRSSR